MLKPPIHRRGGDLSSGQQQQAIARARAAGSKLLILDEPTEGIKPGIVTDIGQVFRRLADRGMRCVGGGPRAVVLTELYYDFATERADQRLVMARGVVVIRGCGKDVGALGARQRLAI